MTVLYRFVDAAVKPLGSRELEGIAATEIMCDDGFALCMSGADVSRLQNGPLLVGHDPLRAPAGVITSAKVGVNNVSIRARLASAGISQQVDELCGLIKDGILNSLSLGFVVDAWEYIDARKPSLGRLATKWHAIEVSLVGAPADPGAVILARARAAERRGAEAPLSDDERRLAALAAQSGERLTATRVRQIVSEARRIGRDPGFHFQWMRANRGASSADSTDYLERQARLRELSSVATR